MSWNITTSSFIGNTTIITFFQHIWSQMIFGSHIPVRNVKINSKFTGQVLEIVEVVE